MSAIDNVIHEIAYIGNRLGLTGHRFLEGRLLLTQHLVGDILHHAKRLADAPVVRPPGSTQLAYPANRTIGTPNAILDGAVLTVLTIMAILVGNAFTVFFNDITDVVGEAFDVFHKMVDAVAVNPRTTFAQIQVTFVVFIVDEVTDIGDLLALPR